MGEVYRAHDRRLGRDVALKILPAVFTADADRLARFEREARVLASLNHPNIATIHGVEESDGIRALVLELVEGETLAERIARGLHVAEALAIARQIAEALDAAHERGIIHRDLKPANIKVTPGSLVKVLDFGLAKVVEATGLATGADASTVTAGGTREGVVLGTAAYMSPEQARGQAVDKRTDIWAFGCVLYELLTGRRAFSGETVSDTIVAVLEREPDWSALPDATPASVRGLLRRCVEKDAAQRLRDIGDARIDLRDAMSGGGNGIKTIPLSRRGWWMRTAAAVVLMAAGLAALTRWLPSGPDGVGRNPLADATFERLTDFDGSELDAAISPDGKFVAFLTDRDGPFDAFVTQVGSGEFLNLTKGMAPQLLNEDVQNVGFSPDGARVWIRVGGTASPAQISVVPTLGGAMRPFLDTAVTVAWSSDGSRAAYHEATAGDTLYVADRNVGNPQEIFTSAAGTHNHFPAWSPDGRFIYFVRGLPPDEMDIWRIPSGGGEPEQITSHHSRVAYPTPLDDRTLLYIASADDGSGQWLYSMDLEERVARRLSVTVEQYISIAASAAIPGQPRRLVATVSNPSVNVWTIPIVDGVSEEAAASRVTLPTARSSRPRLGPGYMVYLAARGATDGLWRLKDGSATELWRASDGAVAAAAAVSPDGGQLCFPVRRQNRATVHCTTAEGTNARAIAESLDVYDFVSWSPDGKWLAVAARQGDEGGLFKVPLDGGAPVRLVDSVTANPLWSPDGTFILYSHLAGPRRGRLVPLAAVTPEGQPYPLPELFVDRLGDSYRFLPTGKQLVLRQGGFRRHNFWIYDLATGRQRQLTNLQPGSSIRSFDVSPDGARVVFDRVRENSDVVLIEIPSPDGSRDVRN